MPQSGRTIRNRSRERAPGALSRRWPALPGGRLRVLEDPGVEEGRQIRARLLLGERDELRRRDVAVAVLRRPVLDEPEERRVADLLAQCLEGHPAAVVHGAVEEQRGVAEGVDGAPPERGVLRGCVVQLLEPLSRALVSLM